MQPLVLGGEVGEGSVKLLNGGHNVLGGDRGAGTEHLNRLDFEKLLKVSEVFT